MALVNRTKREINAKLVYCGPTFGGKRTNLEFIYKKLKPETRGKLKSVSTQNDRMLFFDFMPAELSDFDGYSVRFHIYTISGEVSQPAIWKMVLKGVDGIVFVADASPGRVDANVESMKELVENLQTYGKGIQDIPCVIQLNKQDASTAASAAELLKVLEIGDLPVVVAKAKKGEGVVASLNKLIKAVLQDVKENNPLFSGDLANGVMAEPEPKAPSRKSSVANAAAGDAPSSDSFDDLATFTIAQASEPGNTLTGGTPSSAMGQDPFVEVAGEVEVLSDGRLRLPLAVVSGQKKKMVAITISLSIDDLMR
jgi:signal recognition particle receptor subunit beta